MPFFANKGFHLRLDLDIFQLTNNQEAFNIAKHIEDILKQLHTNLLMFQKAQKIAANFHHTPAPLYQIKDQVWVKTCNINTQKLSKKLDTKWIGSFLVQELIAKSVCLLDFPATFWIHLVFYILLLCPATQHPVSG